MTISIRITQTSEPKPVKRGGLVAAFAGEDGFVPGGSTDVEISSDLIDDSAEGATAFLESAGPVAATTFRSAFERIPETPLVVHVQQEYMDQVKYDNLPNGIVIIPSEAGL